MNKKPFTTSIWWLGTVLALQGLLFFATIVYIQSQLNPYRDELRRHFMKQAINFAIMAVVLVAELVIYWKLRYHISKKQLAVMHGVGVFFAFVLVPLIYVFYLRYSQVDEAKITSINTIRWIITWSLFVIAQGLFVTVWIDTRKRRKVEALMASGDGKDILNDYAGE